MPHARLRALRRLTEAGVTAGLIVAPVLPGITDTERRLDALLAAAKRAGASYACPSPLRMYAAVRPLFLPLVDKYFPRLAPRYRAAYQGAGFPPRDYGRALSERFRHLAKKHGITIDTSMRDTVPGATLRPSAPSQLPLFHAAKV
jgi:DNA repair photolyase